MYFENNSEQVGTAMTSIWASLGKGIEDINQQLSQHVDSVESNNKLTEKEK